MLTHEKKAFWKFFSIYFGSVSLLILISGFFYYEEQKQHLIEAENFQLIDYARRYKMSEGNYSDPHITHIIVQKEFAEFSMDNFHVTQGYFEKYVPHNWDGNYLRIRKSTDAFTQESHQIKLTIIAVQFALMALFALISYLLARSALYPMQQTISRLDRFAKDLIHDLNTPITSILLSMKLLEKESSCRKNKAYERMKKNVRDISKLHTNLTTLLEEETFQLDRTNICTIVNEVVATHKALYPKLTFNVECQHFYASLNAHALRQILTNLLSNACKYNKEKGFITIRTENNTLTIEDSGIGIKEPEKVFERSYSEHANSSGIGLDIVKRLCDAMQIRLELRSVVNEGSSFSLTFP